MADEIGVGDSVSALLRKILGADREAPAASSGIGIPTAPAGPISVQSAPGGNFRDPNAALAAAQPQAPGAWSAPVDQFGQPARPQAALPPAAPVARAAQVPVQTGAIPPPAPMAAPIDQPTGLNAIDKEDNTDLAPQGIPAPAVAAKPAVKPITLVEQYSQALKDLKKTDTSGRLTKDQLSFWLNMLAAASEPGARAGGAIGKAGSVAMKEMTEQERYNHTAAMEMLKSNKEDVYRLAVMADKQGDNERAAEQLRINEERYKRVDAEAAERNRILREQVEQGKKKTIETPDGWYVVNMTNPQDVTLLKDPKTGKVMKPEYKPSADPRTPELQVMDKWMKSTPEQKKQMEEYWSATGKKKEERDRDEEKIGTIAAKVYAEGMGKITPEAARDTATRMVTGATGALPKGIPAGSKAIGTDPKTKKTVYLDPATNKRYIPD
jgi:hypothetical protein